MKSRKITLIETSDWDEFVKHIYSRPYCFQQQDGCKARGSFRFTVPIEEPLDYTNDELPEVINHPEMGVSFGAWLARDPNQKLAPQSDGEEYTWRSIMWWERNFYPHIEMIINDLYKRGLLEEGEYLIDIDW